MEQNRVNGVFKADENESRLIAMAKEGNRRAFENLVSLCAADIYNFAYRLCGNTEKARDIAQDAFVNAYKAIGSFREETSFSAWVRRITLNAWKYTVRYEIRRMFSKHDSLDEPVRGKDGSVTEKQIPSAESGAETAAERGLSGEKVWQVLNNMDPVMRQMIVLRDIEEKSYEEISIVCNINPGTVKSRIARARQAFKQLYGDGEENG